MKKTEKEIKKVFILQPEDYGKRANEYITRLDNYRNKIRKIYKILQVKTITIKVLDGDRLIELKNGTVRKAAAMVTEYGKRYFLDIFYTNTRDAILIKVRGLVPEKAA